MYEREKVSVYRGLSEIEITGYKDLITGYKVVNCTILHKIWYIFRLKCSWKYLSVIVPLCILVFIMYYYFVSICESICQFMLFVLFYFEEECYASDARTVKESDSGQNA